MITARPEGLLVRCTRTTDKNLRFQQNLQGRKLAIVVLSNSRWRLVRCALELIVTAVNNAKPGSYTLVDIPIR